MNIVLTGLMGTGKTAVGKLLASKLGWQYFDIDALIEDEVKLSISEIFARQGEPAFRDLETKAIQLLTFLDRSVISCGGGAVLRSENMDALERNGFVVCLTAAPEVIFERIKGDTARPLIQVPDPLAKIKEIQAARAKYYARCAFSIDTGNCTIEQVVAQILTAYDKKQ